MVAFRLALALGMTVREVLDRHDSRELAEWMAFDRLNPIDAARRIETAIGLNTAATVAAGGNQPGPASAYVVQYGREYRQPFEAERAVAAAAEDQASLAARVDAALDLF